MSGQSVSRAISRARSTAAVPVAAATGAVGFLALLNELLRQHGSTLDTLASEAGPIAGAVALAWPHLLGLFFFGLWAHGQWAASQARARKQAQDQLTALRLVATEVGHVGAEVGQVVGAVDALRADVTQLSSRVDASDQRTKTEVETFRAHVNEQLAALRIYVDEQIAGVRNAG